MFLSLAALLLHAAQAVLEFHSDARSKLANVALVFATQAKTIAARVARVAVEEISIRDTPSPRAAIALVKAHTAIATAAGNWPMAAGEFHVGWLDAIGGLQSHLFEAHREIAAEAERLARRVLL